MNQLYRSFHHTFRWTAIESIIYESLLFLHQCILFWLVDIKLYGLIGASIGLIYLCVYVLQLGFDKALAPFFHTYCQNKKNIQRLFFWHVLPTYIFVLITAVICFSLLPSSTRIFNISLNPMFFLLMTAIVLIEIHKKVMKTILRLALLSHLAAPIEVGCLVMYLIGVWGYYLFTGTITFFSALIPLFVSALLGSFAMLKVIINWYKQKQEVANSLPTDMHIRFCKNRFHTLFLHLNRQLFSTNFFIPVFAHFYGFAAAGMLKIASRLTSTVMIITRKILETPTNVFFANIQGKKIEKQTVFSYASYWINQAVYAIIIFTAINYMKLFGKNIVAAPTFSIIAYFGIFYFIIRLCGNFCISYEQFYIAYERPGYLVGINTICLLLLGSILYYATSISASTMLLIVCLMRVTSCFLFASFSYYCWSIKPNWKVDPLCQVSALIFALLFFILR